MQHRSASRRDFLHVSTAALASGLLASPGLTSSAAGQETPRSPNARPRIGAVGLRYQGTVVAVQAQRFGDVVAVCDVDRNVREQARASFGSTPAIFEDYRDMIARPDIDVVTIGAPDHWHAKMVVDACRAGKDVYVEKPLSMTIDEGKVVSKVVKETGRVVQVGSWQRSDQRFRLAAELVRQGRIGELKTVVVVLGKNVVGGPFEPRKVPDSLNWDLWQGQTPDVPYLEQRAHYTFRWWYEYSGGQMTDWGAHHVDIAEWAINSHPVEITGKARYPETPNGYNVAIDFSARYRYANGVEMTISDSGRNGILFSGTAGRIFVNRGTLEGKPVDQLAAQPLRREQFQLYAHENLERPERVGKLDAITNHMGNFFDCLATRNRPLSDVWSQHRSISTCHLGNIAMRLDRTLRWDPEAEQFIGDSVANEQRRREQRSGFEVA